MSVASVFQQALMKVLALRSAIPDFHFEWTGSDTTKIFNIMQQFGSIGLSYYVRNRGASAITINVDKDEDDMTLDGGDFIYVSEFWHQITITNASAVNVDVKLQGMRLSTLDVIG